MEGIWAKDEKKHFESAFIHYRYDDYKVNKTLYVKLSELELNQETSSKLWQAIKSNV